MRIWGRPPDCRRSYSWRSFTLRWRPPACCCWSPCSPSGTARCMTSRAIWWSCADGRWTPGMGDRDIFVDHAAVTLEHAKRNAMMNFKTPRRPQFFYTTAPLPCPYVAGRTERKVVTEIAGPGTEALHDRLSRAGFRRSHNIAYAPVCPSCQACIPIRIPVATFQPGTTLRRIARVNAAMEAFVIPPRATAEQFQLFQRYQQARHGGGDM